MSKKLLSILLSLTVLIISCLPFSFAYAAEFIVVSSENANEKFDVYSGFCSALDNAFEFCRKNATSKNRCTITTPGGSFEITKKLILPSNTTLDMTAGTELYNPTNNDYLFHSERDVSQYNGLHDFTLKGGCLRYDKATYNGGAIVRIAHAKNVTFDSTKFISDHHLLEIAAVKNFNVLNCSFEGDPAVMSDEGKLAFQIDILDENEHFRSFPVYDYTMNDSVTVKGCTFKNLSRGVGIQSSFPGLYHNNINISNNTFTNIAAVAIFATNYINSTISNNTISNCQEGICYYLMKTDVSTLSKTDKKTAINTNCNSKIINNKITVKDRKANVSSKEASAIKVRGKNVTAADKPAFATGDYYVGNITVSGNTVSTTAYGIRLYDVKKSTFSGNTVSSNKKIHHGFYVTDKSTSNTFKSNRVTNFQHSILINGNSTGNTVTSNTLKSPAKNGVIVMEKSNNTSITKNTINSTGTNGVCANASSCKAISSNTITSPAKNGIYLENGASVTDIKSNTISKAGSNGVLVYYNSKVTNITSNKITSCKSNGISNYNKISKIESNTLNSNKSYGVYNIAKASAVLYKNSFSKNSAGNIRSKGSKKSYTFSNLSTPSITLSSKKNAVTVKWKKVKDASSYYIYRSASKNGTYKKIASVSSSKTSYTNKKLKKGKTYYYKVRAIKKANNITAYSSYSKIKQIKVKK